MSIPQADPFSTGLSAMKTSPLMAGNADSPKIKIDKVTHTFTVGGQDTQVLRQIDLEIPAGGFVSIVGPSGCGKTTLLNMIAGLIGPTGGQVLLDGSVITGTSRTIGYMSARDGLLPWRTAQRNVELGLELRGISKSQRAEPARHFLNMVGLSGFEESFPAQLSQGMRQRVALARTLIVDPDLLLLDEPFAAVDAQTRLLLQKEFTNLWEGSGKTVVLITHDLTEAVTLGDRVLIFSPRPGEIRQDITLPFGRPRDVENVRFEKEFTEISAMLWAELQRGEGENVE